jgi:polyphosphate kinase
MSRKPSLYDDIPATERFINRELSWLAFNNRVLDEARNPHNPLLERVNFLSICGSNLDEFYMVRVAGLMDKVQYNICDLSDDGLTPTQQLERIHVECSKLLEAQQACWEELSKSLKKQGVHVVGRSNLFKDEKIWLKDYFYENLFPVLTPIAIDPAHPFPFVPNKGIAQLFTLRFEETKKKHSAVILFPSQIKRFIRLPLANGKKTVRFIRVEDVIELFLDTLFPGYTILESGLIRVLRDSDLDIEDEEAEENLVQHFEQAIKQRRRGRVVRLKVSAAMPDALLHLVLEHMRVPSHDVYRVQGMVGIPNLSELIDLDRPDLRYPAFKERFPERIKDFDGDCFAAIAAKDIVVHHPYESFDVVVQFLRQAARDPDVMSIKLTLYRTSKQSPIIAALIEAAENGKSVTAVVELKARFDEEANIKWARDMERAGVQVVYGFVRLKTHAKVTLITRKTEHGLQSFAHFGTGNYHPSTAKIYTDLSYFTCDETLCRDAAYFFNFVTGYAPPRDLQQLVLAPKDMRRELQNLIAHEIAFAMEGKPANIWVKLNSLLDPEIIDSLYKASQAGVKITLVVRGICSLRPGVIGLSDNIIVKSVVGRFLEHARIICFGNGHELPSDKAKVFIASADWMPRNFNGRVEVMVPIHNPTVHAQILGQIMVANVKDEKQSWYLQPDGSYLRVPHRDDAFSAHEYFMKNPSLSGRGKALQKAGHSANVYELRK